MNDVETCSVCGRTILAGERTRVYLTPDGERRDVCDLCRDRAEHVGWVWEEMAAQIPLDAGRRRIGLSSMLRGWAERRREAAASQADRFEGQDPVAAVEEPEPGGGAGALDVTPEPAPPRPAPPRRSPDPAAPGAGVGRTMSAAESRMSRIEQAIDRFNRSEQFVIAYGLARTLGGPWVSVGSGSPDEVRITVAWELSWYQWGVDLSDELRPVYEIGKGGEVDELDAPARQWNARMEGDGIELGVVPIDHSGNAGGGRG